MDNCCYYNNSELLSHNALFNWLNGMRSHGKTFSFKEWCIRDFLKRGNEFVWLRRYKEETKNVITSFDTDIIKENKFPGVKFSTDGKTFFINKKKAGYFLTLSMSQYYKSMAFPNVNKIIFDEYLITDSKITYLPNEAYTFLELYSTISRTRDCRAFFIANNASVRNPYFTYFNFYPQKGKRFTKKGDMLIEMDSATDFKNKVYETRFGKMIEGTTYGNYAVENEFLLDNDEYVEKKPNTAIYQLTLAYDGKYYGLYYDLVRQLMYCTERKTLNGGLAVAVNKSDMTDNAVLSRSQAIKATINTLKELFSLGRCRYDNVKVKAAFNDIMKELCIK